MAVKMKLEVSFDGTGTSWVDLSNSAGAGDFLMLAKGIDITRGRATEADDPMMPGTCTLVLDNSDYRFSPGMGGPYDTYISKPGSLLRLSAWVNGGWKRRFWGVVQSWNCTNDNDGTGKRSICTVLANDIFGAFPSYTFRQAADEVPRNTTNIVHHWPLRDTAAPCQPLIGTKVLKGNGGTGLGLGTLLPMDEGTDPHPLFVSSSGKLKLTSEPLGIPRPWTVSIVFMTRPTANGDLLDINTAFQAATWSTGATLAWSTTDGFTLGSMGACRPSADQFPVQVNISCNSSNTELSVYDASANLYAVNLPRMAALNTIVVNPTLSGGSQWGAAHLTVTSDDHIPNSYLLLAPREGSDSALGWVALFAGEPTMISGTPASPDECLPYLDGRDAAEVASAMLTGTGARLVDNLNGGLVWTGFAPSSATIAVPKVTRDLSWGSSSASWCSDCTVTRYDGQTYTATRTDGKRQSITIEGAHATWARDRSMADWLVNTAAEGGRCPSVPVDMLAITDAQRAALCDAGPASRLAPATPPYMPANTILLCEGLTEHIDAGAWTITYNTSPDIYSRLLIWDNAQNWDAGWLWAP